MEARKRGAAGHESPSGGLRYLYLGPETAARNFRLALLIIDGLLLAFFVGATFLDDAPWLIGLDLAIAGLLSADVLARLWIADFRPRAFLRAHL